MHANARIWCPCCNRNNGLMHMEDVGNARYTSDFIMLKCFHCDSWLVAVPVIKSCKKTRKVRHRVRTIKIRSREAHAMRGKYNSVTPMDARDALVLVESTRGQ